MTQPLSAQLADLGRITLAPGIEASEDTLRRWHALFYLPGEQVRVDPDVRFAGETDAERDARVATLGGGTRLTIRETRVEPATRAEDPVQGNIVLGNMGGVIVTYAFEGIPGSHNAKAFMNPAGYEHHYGCLIQRAGRTWVVPLTTDLDEPALAGEAREISSTMSRYAKWAFGMETDQDVANFFAGHAEDLEPAVGEFIIIPNGHGLWQLEACPWATGCGVRELQLARQAIDEAVAKRREQSVGEQPAAENSDPAYQAWTWAVVGLCADASAITGPEARAWCAAHAEELVAAYRAGTDPLTAYNTLAARFEQAAENTENEVEPPAGLTP